MSTKKIFTVNNNQVIFIEKSKKDIFSWFAREKYKILEMELILNSHATEKELLIYKISDTEEYQFINKCYIKYDTYLQYTYGKEGLVKLKTAYNKLKINYNKTEEFINQTLVNRLYEN